MTELDKVGFEKALESGKTMVVDFWAAWCMPCKIFSPVMEDVSAMMGDKADFYKINVDENNELAEKYEIASIPTVIIFKDGKNVGQLIGVWSKDDVVDTIKKHL